jgi:hypothetical protein
MRSLHLHGRSQLHIMQWSIRINGIITQKIFTSVTTAAVSQCVIKLFSQTNALAQIRCTDKTCCWVTPCTCICLMVTNCSLSDCLTLDYVDLHLHPDSKLRVCSSKFCTQPFATTRDHLTVVLKTLTAAAAGKISIRGKIQFWLPITQHST